MKPFHFDFSRDDGDDAFALSSLARSLLSRTCDGSWCSPGSSHGPRSGTRAQGLVEPALLLLLLLLLLLRLLRCGSRGIFGEAERRVARRSVDGCSSNWSSSSSSEQLLLLVCCCAGLHGGRRQARARRERERERFWEVDREKRLNQRLE